ncbi:MAG: 2'-5' RNA ligase family protein [Mycobacteriales bacterium]
MARAGVLTIGVAFALPEPHASMLRRMRQDADDPQATIVPPHVTFLPPSVVRRTETEGVERHLATVAARHEPFDLHLSGAGSFRPVSQVVFAQVSEGIAACELLAADVCSGPLAIDRSFPYHPHVTVAHDVGADALDRAYAKLRPFDATLCVCDFTLFEQSDNAWRIRRVFGLGHRVARAGRPTRDLKGATAAGHPGYRRRAADH